MLNLHNRNVYRKQITLLCSYRRQIDNTDKVNTQKNGHLFF